MQDLLPQGCSGNRESIKAAPIFYRCVPGTFVPVVQIWNTSIPVPCLYPPLTHTDTHAICPAPPPRFLTFLQDPDTKGLLPSM